MTIESPKQKPRRRKPKKQKRGGASRPKDNSVISPFNSAACAARLLLILSRGTISVSIIARLGFCYCAILLG